MLGERGAENKAAFVGMPVFGATGETGDLYRQFGITAEEVAEKAAAML